MKYIVAISALAAPALASLNCTVTAAEIERYCEWDDCQPAVTLAPGDNIHAGCRADCSDEEDPWFKLYDGYLVRAVQVEGCNYHGTPFPVLGLPTCYEEAQLPKPTNCSVSSSMGAASLIPQPSPLGPEPPPIPGIGDGSGGTESGWKMRWPF